MMCKFLFLFVCCITLVNGATISYTDSTNDVTDSMTTDSTVTEAACGDKLDNCFYYGDEQCVGRYEPWARDNCAYRCGYCAGNYPPCEDQITYCNELGSDACTQKVYSGFIRLNCRKTCNKCTVPGLNYVPKNNTDAQPTDLVPTKPSENKPTVSQTTNQTGCRDKKENCFNYDDYKCLGIYEPWARDNCAYRCGYCPEKPPCINKITYCDEFGDNVCTEPSYAGWVRLNCRKYCNKCDVPYHGNNTETQVTNQATSTTPKHMSTEQVQPKSSTPKQISTEQVQPGSSTPKPVSTDQVTPPNANTGEPSRQTTIKLPVLPTGDACRDVRDDCANYDKEACNGVFKAWAIANCAETCGYCTNSQTACEDYENCGHLPQTLCTAVEYRDIATTSCRKFCGFCSDTIPSTERPTQPTAMPTTSTVSVMTQTPSAAVKSTTKQTMITGKMTASTMPPASTEKLNTEQPVVNTEQSSISTPVPITIQPSPSTDHPTPTPVLSTKQQSPSTDQPTSTPAITTKQPSPSTDQPTSTPAITTKQPSPSTDQPTSNPAESSTSGPTPQKAVLTTILPTPPKPVKTTVLPVETSSQAEITTNQPDRSTTKMSTSVATMGPTDPSMTPFKISMEPTTSSMQSSKQVEMTSKITEMPTPPKPVATSPKLTPQPVTSIGQPTPSPLNPEISKGQPTPSPTLPTFSASSAAPGVCNKNYVEPVPQCCKVCACPGEEVFGRVINQLGEPLSNAEVSFSGCDCVRYLTDPSGNYAIQNLCIAGHEMFFSRAGYMPSKVLPVPVVTGGNFWKADNMLTVKPNVSGLNVTGTPPEK